MFLTSITLRNVQQGSEKITIVSNIYSCLLCKATGNVFEDYSHVVVVVTFNIISSAI